MLTTPTLSFTKIIQWNRFFKSIFFFVLINFLNFKYINLIFKPEFYGFFMGFKITQKKLVKNRRKSFPKVRRSKNSYTLNRFTGNVKFKFSNFFYLNQKKKPQNLLKFSSTNINKYKKQFTHLFFLSYRHFFCRRWFYLTGFAVPKMASSFKERKKWIYRNIKFKIKYNYKYYKVKYRKRNLLRAKLWEVLTKKTLTSKRLLTKYLKTIYYDNIFYFFKTKIRYKRLKFFIKLIRVKFPDNMKQNCHYQSYLFLNNIETHFKKSFFALKQVYRIFKLHKKLFRVLKRRNYWTKKWAHVWFKAYSNVNLRTNKQLVTFGPKLNIKHRLRKFFNSKLILIHKKCHLKTKHVLTFVIHKKKRAQIKSFMRSKWIEFFAGYNSRRMRRRIVYPKLKKILNISIYFFKKFSKNRLFLRFVTIKNLKIVRKIFKRRRNRRWYNWRITRKFRKWSFWVLLNKKISHFNSFFKYNQYKIKNNIKSTQEINFNFFKKTTLVKKLLWFKLLKRKPVHFFRFKNTKNTLTTSVSLKFLKSVIIKSSVYSLLKKPVLTATHRSNFIIGPSGFLLLTNTLFLNYNNKNKQRVYLIRKKMYSFAYKSEMRKHILKKSSKWLRSSMLTSFFRKRRGMRWKKFYNPVYKELQLSTRTPLFNFNTPVSNLRSLLSDSDCSPYSLTFKQYDKRKNLGTRRSRIKIPKIYFKGSSTLRRRSRLAVLQSLTLKFRYQHQLTKFIINYKKILHIKFLPIFEMRLLNILIRTRLVLDQATATQFLNNRLVFINGICCSNRYLQIFTNDFIQLILTFKYYIVFRWLLNNSIRIKKHIKHLSWKNKQRKHSEDKQWNHHLQKMVLPHKHLNLDVAKYLEVDFFTLSSFVLYDPFLWSDLDRNNILNVRYGIFNVHNWKYIN